MIKFFRSWAGTAQRSLDELLPDHCVLCRVTLTPRPKTLLCEHCHASLPFIVSACRACGLPLADGDAICGACTLRPLTHGRVVVPLAYTPVTTHLMHRFKFQHGIREMRTLAECMLARIEHRQSGEELPAALVAMPMSYRAQVRRGDHPVLRLTHYLGQRLGLPIDAPIRRNHGPPQREKTRAARLRLSSGAFARRRPVRAAHVALIDDVMTTGQSARVAVRVLEQSGARRVDVWCAARAV